MLKSKKNYSKIDIVSDLVIELEDNKNKFLKDELTITDKMFNNIFFESLIENIPSLCPNIQKLKLLNLKSDNLNITLPLLKKFKNLSHLIIQSSKENSQDTINIGNHLINIPKLQFLSLENIKFSDDFQVKDFKLTKIKVLELKNNGINQNSCSKIFEAISNLNSLKFLTISYNKFTKECGRKLFGAIDKLHNLQYLSFYQNEFDTNIKKFVTKLKKKNCLVEFHLFMNNFKEKYWEKIANQLNWNNLDRVVVTLGIEENIIRTLKNHPIRLFFRNNNLCLEEIVNKI